MRSATSCAWVAMSQFACRANCAIQLGSSSTSSSLSGQTHLRSWPNQGLRQTRKRPSSRRSSPRTTGRLGSSATLGVMRPRRDIARITWASVASSPTSVPRGSEGVATREGAAGARPTGSSTEAGGGPSIRAAEGANARAAWQSQQRPTVPSLVRMPRVSKRARLACAALLMPLWPSLPSSAEGGWHHRSVQLLTCRSQKCSWQKPHRRRSQPSPNWASHSGLRQPMTRSSGTSSAREGALSPTAAWSRGEVSERAGFAACGCTISQPSASSSASGSSTERPSSMVPGSRPSISRSSALALGSSEESSHTNSIGHAECCDNVRGTMAEQKRSLSQG
mmetsp:Transcript_85400/g.276519  ORF Transcript_85400/g.276519 Transcript_85400/m.276519 type:complete len:336 (-) Transcript_85400:3-1010(-)